MRKKGQTPIDKDELRRLWDAGLLTREIAKQMGSSKGNITYHVRRLALPLRGKSRAAAKDGTRTCLCCRKPFASEHVGNRICFSCKQRVEFTPGALA